MSRKNHYTYKVLTKEGKELIEAGLEYKTKESMGKPLKKYYEVHTNHQSQFRKRK